MLIGVRRAAFEETTRFSPPDYRHKLLMRGQLLSKIDAVATKESVLSELIVFKENFDRNETNLVSDEEEQHTLGKIDLSLSRRLASNGVVDCAGMWLSRSPSISP